jgi:hypothetical protein
VPLRERQESSWGASDHGAGIIAAMDQHMCGQPVNMRGCGSSGDQ